MTKDDILTVAREAGLTWTEKEVPEVHRAFERFAAIVAAHEREACAKVCEEKRIQMNYSEAPYNQCAAAIRARS